MREGEINDGDGLFRQRTTTSYENSTCQSARDGDGQLPYHAQTQKERRKRRELLFLRKKKSPKRWVGFKKGSVHERATVHSLTSSGPSILNGDRIVGFWGFQLCRAEKRGSVFVNFFWLGGFCNGGDLLWGCERWGDVHSVRAEFASGEETENGAPAFQVRCRCGPFRDRERAEAAEAGGGLSLRRGLLVEVRQHL